MVEAKGLEPSNLLTASQALYQLSYAPEDASTLSDLADDGLPKCRRVDGGTMAASASGSDVMKERLTAPA